MEIDMPSDPNQRSPKETRSAFAGRHAADDRESAEASRENDARGSGEEVTQEMIEAAIDVLRDPQWTTYGLIEWLNDLSWAGGSHIDTIVARMYRAMRVIADSSNP